MVQPLARKLLQLVSEFEDSATWDHIGASSPILIRLPGVDHAAALSIMGMSGQEFGIIANVDDGDALRMFQAVDGRIDPLVSYAGSHVLAFSLDASSQVVGDLRKILRAGGHRPRAGKRTPRVMARDADDNWRPIRPGEARTLALCIHAVLRAAEGGAFSRTFWALNPAVDALELTVDSDAIEGARAPEVTWAFVPSPLAGKATGGPHRLRAVPDGSATAATLCQVIDEVISDLVKGVGHDEREAARVAYWGPAETAPQLSDEVIDQGAMVAFEDWLVADYRETRDAQTHAERALERPGDWSEREMLALRGLCAGTLTFFEVQWRGHGVVDLTHLWNRSELRAFGAEFASVAKVTTCHALRVMDIDGCWICRLAGPPVLDMVFQSLVMCDGELAQAMRADALGGESWRLGALWGRYDGLLAGEVAMGQAGCGFVLGE